MKTPRDQRCAYSVTFSAEERIRARIHEAFLKFLREVEPLVRESPAQEVYQMNFDLFPWR